MTATPPELATTPAPAIVPRDQVQHELLVLWLEMGRRTVGSEQAAKALESMAHRLRGR